MTTILNAELLLSTLASRIRELNHAPGNNTAASVLEDLSIEIRRGEYEVEAPQVNHFAFSPSVNPIILKPDADPDELAVPMQDPLEAAADRILGSSVFLDTVREIPVGDVVSVQTILYRRASEHEKQVAVILQRRAQVEEAVQGLLSPEESAPMERGRFEAERDDRYAR